MRFIDKVRVTAKAGDGGSGCLSFLREKFKEFGGPNGGSGGKGGDIVFVADRNVGTLLDFSYKPHLKAGNGGAGKGKNKTGADAEDTIVRVPAGTLVYRDGRLVSYRNGTKVLDTDRVQGDLSEFSQARQLRFGDSAEGGTTGGAAWRAWRSTAG